MARPVKPLGVKAYGSTPHLAGSRVGPGDWHIHEGQARILTQKTRDRHDRIIVTEKLDGSCVAAAKLGGTVIALTRAGYLAKDSPHMQHHMFAQWIESRAERIGAVLSEGERLAGEWLAQAHGTRYLVPGEDALLACFAFFRGKLRLPHDEARRRMERAGLVGAAVISDGPPLSQRDAMELLGVSGRHGALEQVEGAVWVAERGGVFDFIAKHVVSGKVDGKYLPSVTGGADVWNEIAGSVS